ncbi:hypothetical protein MTR41_12280, partial [Escherichia coli]|nr:hypothetical protein [Escherichia coli]
MTFASKSLLLAAVFAAVLSGVLWHRLDSTRHDNQTLRRELQTAYSALFDHGLASKSDQRFASIRSTGNLTFSTA